MNAAILIVDDNAGKRLALKTVLSPLGYSIVEANSGEAALRCVLAQDFAVILLDVRMPGMDGFETAGLIRRRRQSEMTPIIFVTAFSSDEMVHTNRYAEGAVDFISTPVAPSELRAKVSVFANIFMKADVLANEARAVQTTADQLRLLTDAAPVGIFQTDADNRYVYTNPRWTDITGIAPEEAIGRKWDTILGPEQRAELVADLAGGGVGPLELWHRIVVQRPGSASRVLMITSKAVPDTNGGTSGWVGTLSDMTAEAGAEAAMADARDKANEASRQKSDFLANMSHEIRTPMNGVIGMTDLLLETNLDARQRDLTQTLRNSGESLLTIINDILDFSKVEAGKLEIEDIEFNLRTVIDDVVDLLAGPAQSKGLDLVAVIDRSVPAVVSGDPGRVRQVVTNLIGNAIKFTQAGEIVVRVSGSPVDGADLVLRIAVSDTGDGIAPDKLETIFHPFVQADTSTSRKYGGTGLGLAISAHLVGLMGGDCGVSSQLGTGSNFWFTVHVHVDSTRATEGQLAPEPGLAGVTALIVDDNATQRDVLSAILDEWGMTVRTADSGPAGLATLRSAAAHSRPFAVALIDQFMPGMDGLELKSAIVADPALATRVVIMTGRGHHGLTDSADSGSDPGVCASLSKPVHRDELRTCLRVLLGLQAADVASPATRTARATTTSSATTASPATTPPPNGSPARALAGQPETGWLLLAEDNLTNQKVAVEMLSGAGYRLDTVLNGAAAVQAVAHQRYDAILMDCHMPELNGYEATAAIRVQEGPGRRTPIIAMTAGARREDQERCKAEGMDSYLAKPINKDALLATVARSVKAGRATVPPPEVQFSSASAGGGAMLGRDVGPEAYQRLLAGFLDELEVHVADLNNAAAFGDVPAARYVAHQLVSNAPAFGAVHLHELADRLLKVGRGQAELLGPLVDQIEVEVEQMQERTRATATTGADPSLENPVGSEAQRGLAVSRDEPDPLEDQIKMAVRQFHDGSQAGAHDASTDGGQATMESQVGSDAYQRLLAGFLDELDWHVAELNSAAVVGNVPAARYVAHQITGNALAFGAARLHELADQVLQVGRDRGDLLASIVDQFAGEVDHLHEATGAVATTV
jgi:two-component system sensor histidine kinase/response regulator